MKDSFILYTAQYKALKELTVEQKGELLDCLFQYVITGIMPATNSESVRVAMNFLRIQIDMDSKKYATVCEKRREAINKRWQADKDGKESTTKQKNTKVNKSISKNTNVTDNDNENENVNDNENENVNDNVEANASLSTSHTHTNTHAHDAGEENKEDRNPWHADSEEKALILMLQYFNKCVDLYHSDIKKVRALTDERRTKLRIILKKYQSQHFTAAISNAMQSAFLNGRTKRRKAAADFDWIIEEKHFVQCIENSL